MLGLGEIAVKKSLTPKCLRVVGDSRSVCSRAHRLGDAEPRLGESLGCDCRDEKTGQS